ncbi:formyltransferase family protein [Pandoraea fibrosis]|uniref:Methionyl-tRNA formyltransferase n=1 Tax=Pandoraea fibrosis TaxID=1891094 RepID=A0A5E4WDS0_9BURK|nr:formyltransferase family protein [Pandoraea fibrosis]VVE21899.1 methionyl-tRNA formyltransferase [Pandoraea fibrosis]
MKKIRVAFLGSRPLGYLTLKLLSEIEGVEVVASVVKEPSATAWWNTDPYDIAINKIDNHRELNNIDFDFGVSVNYWKIIESELIKKPRLGFVNLHHSYNLCLRGRDMASHAIINARKSHQWYHGTTLHYTDDGLDTGPIISARACEITESETAWTLFNKTDELGRQLLEEWLPRLILARVPSAYPEPNNPLNMKARKNEKYIENIFADPLLTYDIVRAFDFKLHYDPAYTEIDGREVRLTVDKEFAGREILSVDEKRVVYEVKNNAGNDGGRGRNF